MNAIQAQLLDLVVNSVTGTLACAEQVDTG
jgi:hypothetical protein